MISHAWCVDGVRWNMCVFFWKGGSGWNFLTFNSRHFVFPWMRYNRRLNAPNVPHAALHTSRPIQKETHYYLRTLHATLHSLCIAKHCRIIPKFLTMVEKNKMAGECIFLLRFYACIQPRHKTNLAIKQHVTFHNSSRPFTDILNINSPETILTSISTESPRRQHKLRLLRCTSTGKCSDWNLYATREPRFIFYRDELPIFE